MARAAARVVVRRKLREGIVADWFVGGLVGVWCCVPGLVVVVVVVVGWSWEFERRRKRQAGGPRRLIGM